MIESILDWVNNQSIFPKKIDNIEEEFANGYYFGKLLESNKLFDNMKELKNTNKKEDSINNYFFLHKIFNKLDINLAESDINELLNKKKHKAELYIYRIKQKISLENCQFNEITLKIKEEQKINDIISNPKKRNQSAKPQFHTKILNTNTNVDTNYNQTKTNFLTSANEDKKNRKTSVKDKIGKINYIDHKSRLKSAKLPSLKKNEKKRQQLNDNNKNNEPEKADEEQIQSVLNEIKIFENIHMNSKKKINYVNSKNPWDKIGYIYSTELLSDKGKEDKDKKISRIFDIIEKENRKENAFLNPEAKEAKFKANLNNYNQFKVDNRKNYINKKNFEQGLFHMGLIVNNMLPSIAKIKDTNIPQEIVLKSINDKLKDEQLKKKSLLNNNINNANDTPSSKKRRVYTPSTRANNKLDSSNRANNFKKRPMSSIATVNNKSKNKNKLNLDNNDKKNETTKKRPLTAKESNKSLKSNENLDKINNIQLINQKYKEYNDDFNDNFKIDAKKRLSQIPEIDINEVQDSFQMESFNNVEEPEDLNENFFKSLHKEKKDSHRIVDQKKRRAENIINKKNIREMIFAIIDMTEVYYDYQNDKNEELIDLDKYHDVKYKFIHNKPIIKRKKKKRVLTEEEIGNSNFDVYTPIDEEYSKNYGIDEINELKNYINNIGNKYDKNKNNLFFKKINLKETHIEINDVMGEEVKLLFDKAKAEGNNVEEEDEEEFKKTGIIKYHPNKDEEELLIPMKTDNTENSFTNLMSEIIQFGYNKDPEKIFSSPEKLKKGVSGVIEEPKKENSFDTKNNEDEKLNPAQDNNNNNNNANNANNNDIINNNENNILFKGLLKSIPIKMCFLGAMNNEIKTIIKASVNKYPKMKVYNPIEFLNDLRLKKKKIDEPIDEQNLRKFQIDQLKKEKNILNEEIKEYIDLIENKNNLSDDEICIFILQKKIREDFEMKNLDNIKQEIISRREQISKITAELNRVREEQQRKQKTNLRELQVYQQQLDKIDFESLAGFIIINFPNNIDQCKLIEEKMSGFAQPCEQNKSDFDEINDKLLFLCDKEHKDFKFIKFNSFFEKIVYFHCDDSKLFPENANPPNTLPVGAVQNIGSPVLTKKEVEEYKNNFKILEDFYQNFNIQIEKYDYYEGTIEENVFLNNNNLNMNSNNYIVRDRVIVEKIKSVLSIYEESNITILMDESCDEGLEDVTQIKDKDSSRKISGDSSLKQAINNSKQQIKPQMKDSSNESILKNEISKMPSINNNNNNPIIDKSSEKKQTQKQIFLSISQISDEEKMNLYQIWYNFNIQYNYYINRIFYRERTLKQKKAEDVLDDIQNNFINFLCNSNESKIIVNQFVQKYRNFRDNYCQSKKINDSSNKTIIKNYQKDLAELNETLWNIAKIRKNQALEEIEKLERENYIKRDLIFCYFKMERFIILETQKLIVIINIFIRYYNLTFNTKVISTQMPKVTLDSSISEEILKDLDKEEYAIQKDKKIFYPRANRLYKNCFRMLIKIYIYLESFYSSISIKEKKGNFVSSNKPKIKKNKKSIVTKNSTGNTAQIYNPNTKMDLSKQIKNSIKTHIKKYKYKVYILYLITLENLSKIFCPFKQIIKLMDNWIVLSMELQNESIEDTIKFLDITNKYKVDNDKLDKKVSEQIEKDIVNLITKEDNDLYNFEYKGIDSKKFILFDTNKYISSSGIGEKLDEPDNDSLKIYEIFKEFDIISKLRNNEIQKGIITKSNFEEIIFKNYVFKMADKFPKKYRNIDYHHVSNFLSHFTVYSYEFIKNKNKIEELKGKPQEYIYINDVITILTLSLIDFELKINDNEEGEFFINKEKFMEINIGFENEITKISDKAKTKEVKLYLFNIHKNSDDIPEINIKKLANLLSLKSIKNEPKDKIKNYFDLFYY